MKANVVMSIGIINIGISNIGSLDGALYNEGWDTILISEPAQLDECSHLILPGVGTFGEGMRRLNACNLDSAIIEYCDSGRPLLGICLGMQLLAEIGTECGETAGLGLIPGKVDLLGKITDSRLPHIGWNVVERQQNHSLLAGIKAGVDFYFVHSFYFNPANCDDVVATTCYGSDYASFVARDNVAGVQFHPEKSQRNGLRILDNFCAWAGNA